MPRISSGLVSIAAKNHALAALFPRHRILGMKDDSPGGSPRSGGQTFAEETSALVRLLFSFLIEDRPQQLIELIRFNSPQCLFLAMIRSPTISTAMRTAAKPVRLPVRVCSIQSFRFQW